MAELAIIYPEMLPAWGGSPLRHGGQLIANFKQDLRDRQDSCKHADEIPVWCVCAYKCKRSKRIFHVARINNSNLSVDKSTGIRCYRSVGRVRHVASFAASQYRSDMRWNY